MTAREAIGYLENEKENHINTHGVTYLTRTEAIDMGIKALAIIDKLQEREPHDMVCVGDLMKWMTDEVAEHYRKLGEYYNKPNVIKWG